jgi:hypothetical protein
MSQGQSAATIQKEVLIQTCLQWSLSVVKPSRYFVFDLNCGCGENKNNGANCLGTGPLARNALQKRGIEGRMFLCDISKKNIESAKNHFFSPQGHLFESGNSVKGIIASFICMDNERFVSTIPTRITESGVSTRFANGIIIADPNGIKVPIKEIGKVSTECPVLDVIIHLYGLKQVCACKLKHPYDPKMNLGPNVVRSCSQIFGFIRKRTWLVSEPFRGRHGRDHLILYGTNLYHDRASVILAGRPNLYRIDSPDGRAVIADMDRFSREVA